MTRSLWQDRRFVRFWAGQTVSQFGDRITELALPLIAVGALHASAGQVAVLTALSWAPNLLALVLGAWVDRRPGKQGLMVAADLVRAGILVSLPVAALFDMVTLGQVYVVALLTGLAGVVFGNAYQSFFARLVPRSSYVDANSKLSASRSTSFIAGPAVGGGLVQLLTAPVAVAVDAVSFVVSAVLVGRIRVDEPRSAAEDVPAAPSLLRSAREGLTFIVRHPVLRAGLACAATLNFFTFLMGTGLLVLFADRELGLSAGVIGLAFGAGATGGLLGAVTAPRISRLIGIGRSVAVGAVLFPAPYVLVWAAEGPWWARAGVLAGVEFVSASGVMLFDVNLNSLNTSVVPDALRSRVAGAYTTMNYGIRPLGALTGGALATVIGLRPTITVAAVGGALSLLWLLPSPVPGIRALAGVGRPDL
ncbi:MFS transporter [Streptomyces brasiliensis]|uniref:MFS transporter n=1 Tax=Streptomyces brasiliensis TaxID=1954 RepID=A0A917NSR1_9ACTN|nr:MFS transporter [Streptomyces brasiliensis]GGJ21413.1 MFS transporter [Streptomyces brasiliensis]